ncbi:MAG: serine hydrolase domain-containing protein [Candidatus Hodarchaeota archaeon]
MLELTGEPNLLGLEILRLYMKAVELQMTCNESTEKEVNEVSKKNQNLQTDVNLSQKIDELIFELISSCSPGCVVTVIQNGTVVHSKGYGLANLSYSIPNSADTAFYIASIAKQFTAMCIAILIEQGKLSLNDDIRKYIPDIPDYGHVITIRHLLHHMSGLRE